MCRIGDLNCSQASLASIEARALLQNLPTSNPSLHEELTHQQEPTLGEEIEPVFVDEGVFETDDMGVPTEVLIDHLISDGSELEHGYAVDAEGCIVRDNLAEHLQEEDGDVDTAASTERAAIFEGRGVRVKKKRILFGGDHMWET